MAQVLESRDGLLTGFRFLGAYPKGCVNCVGRPFVIIIFKQKNMKKILSKLFIFSFVFSLLPLNISQAITQVQISAEVQIVCTDGADNWFSGSGTIIDPKGIILTNRHVVEGAYKNICFIGFLESINQEPDFGTKENPNLAEVKYITNTSDMDAAVLYLNNPNNKLYPFVDIWNSNSSNLNFGNKIEVVGFPSIGGSTITYSSGDFSGFGSRSDGTQNYIKTTAPLEHGNSGGAAYASNGQFVGIPTMVVAGELNSLSYILSANSIKTWLNSALGNQYQEVIINQVPETTKPTINMQSDITPPVLKGFNIDYKIINNNDLKKSYIQYSIKKSEIVEDNGIEKIYYYFGDNELADPLKIGKSFSPGLSQQKYEIPENFLLTGETDLYLIIRLQDSFGNISDSVIAPWKTTYMKQIGLVNGLYSNAITEFKGANKSLLNKYSGRFIRNNNQIWWVSPRDKVRFLVYDQILGTEYLRETVNLWLGSQWNGLSVATGIKESDLIKRPKSIWGHFLSVFKNDMSGFSDGACGYGCYINPDNGNLIYLGSMVSYGKDGKEGYETILKIAKNISNNEINQIEPLGKNNYVWKSIQSEIELAHVPLYYSILATANNQELDVALSNKLKGKILLQIESHGEAWYVNPKDGKRYYMADGTAAYSIMRKLGVGINNQNYSKILSSKTYAKSQAGKIFIKTEDLGKAYYIDSTGVAYYLKDGAEAYNIMRKLGLGIKTSDLEKIQVGE